jgi:phosphate-selective porin OprO/OprP
MEIIMKIKKISQFLAMAGLISLPALSYADSTEDLVNALVTKGVLTEEEGALLSKNRTKEKKSEARVTVDKKGLTVKSSDDSYKIQIGGRLHATYAVHSDESLANASGTGIDDPTDGTEIRRARIYVKGKMNNKLGYMAEIDFGGNKTSLKDVYLDWSPNKNWVLTAGNQKHAFSMEVQESSNDIMFGERSMVTALTVPAFDRAIGVNLKAIGKNWNIQGGFYGEGASSNTDDGSKEKSEGKGFAIRGTWNPVLEKDRMIHLGANYGYRKISDDNTMNSNKAPRFRYETTNLSSLYLVDSGSISNANDLQMGILEFAAMNGPFSFQSEIAKGTMTRDKGSSDYDVSAYYAQVAWTLTGESRTYKSSDGEFKRLKPKNAFDSDKGTWGAWELALRHDGIDLNDGNDFSNKGDAKRYTLNLNWYLNENVRMLAGYERTYDLDNAAVTKLGGGDADDIDVFHLRAQWAI